MLRLLLAISLVAAACTPGAPATPGSTPAPPAGGSPTVPATAAVTPAPATSFPIMVVTPAPPTGAPSIAACDPYYGDCEDKYTPRSMPETPRPVPGNDIVVSTHQSAEHGIYLVDGDGLTLYTFANDSSTVSACAGSCAETWPPVVGQPVTVIVTGIDGTFGRIERDDGAIHVTYNNQPLYYFSGDAEPGDANGDGIGGVWHLARP